MYHGVQKSQDAPLLAWSASVSLLDRIYLQHSEHITQQVMNTYLPGSQPDIPANYGALKCSEGVCIITSSEGVDLKGKAVSEDFQKKCVWACGPARVFNGIWPSPHFTDGHMPFSRPSTFMQRIVSARHAQGVVNTALPGFAPAALMHASNGGGRVPYATWMRPAIRGL